MGRVEQVTRRILRPVAVAAIGCTIACVPATEEEAPRGALSVVTAPSDASRGGAFVTTDGWKLRIEALDILAWFYAKSDARPGSGRWGTLTQRLFRARDEVATTVRAIPSGASKAVVQIAQGLHMPVDLADGYTEVGVDPADVSRFAQRPDDCAAQEDCATSFGPTVYVRVRAERGSRRITLDLTLRANDQGEIELPGTVATNDLTRVTVRVLGERLFTNPAGRLVFADFAAADADGDGVLTARELLDADSDEPAAPSDLDPPLAPSREGEPGDARATMLEVLQLRTANLFSL